jgi:hypothetical protein
MAKDDIMQHHRADKYTAKRDIDNALSDFVKRTEADLEICPALLRLVVKGVKEHLKGGKAWQAKDGRSRLSLSFLACYSIAKKHYSNKKIAKHLSIEYETAKGFQKKFNSITDNEKITLNFYLHCHKAMIESGYSVLDLLLEYYRG